MQVDVYDIKELKIMSESWGGRVKIRGQCGGRAMAWLGKSSLGENNGVTSKVYIIWYKFLA